MIRAILFSLLLVPLAAQTAPKPLFIDPHYHGSCDPEAVWNPERGEAWIYYTARRSTLEKASYVGTPIGVDGKVRAYYRVAEGGGIQWSETADLKTWTHHGKCAGEVNRKGAGYQEAPYVFRFGGFFWMLTDPHKGLAVYRSQDGITWKQSRTILEKPGTGPQDGSLGRHPSVLVRDGRAFLFYHVEPRRPYPTPPPEIRRVDMKKSVLQIAELRVVDGHLVCDRDAPVKP
jgi:hypothetical protein